MCNTNFKDFPEKLKKIRIKSGDTQQVLSDFLKISRTYISDLERGEKLPHIHFLLSIADRFDVSIDWLLGRDHKQTDLSGLSPSCINAIETLIQELK